MKYLFSNKDFLTGDTVTFKLYKIDGAFEEEKIGTEIGSLGIYSADFSLSPSDEYILIAESELQEWRDFKYITFGRGGN